MYLVENDSMSKGMSYCWQVRRFLFEMRLAFADKHRKYRILEVFKKRDLRIACFSVITKKLDMKTLS